MSSAKQNLESALKYQQWQYVFLLGALKRLNGEYLYTNVVSAQANVQLALTALLTEDSKLVAQALNEMYCNAYDLNTPSDCPYTHIQNTWNAARRILGLEEIKFGGENGEHHS